MMMMSTPSTTFHDYLKTNGFSPKAESLSPIQIDEDQLEPSFDNNRNSTIKRPMNAFLLWARGERKRVSSNGGGVSQTSLSKFLGETWRHMSVDEKQPFLDTAESLKKQHHIDHPDYRFRPKKRSTTAAKTMVKKHHASTPQRKLSNMISSSSHSSTLPAFFAQQSSSSSMSSAAPHPVQSTVLAMCQAIIPESSNNNNDWFSKLIGQSHPVIVAPSSRTQTSLCSSRRAVRIQIINKHDDIVLPPPSLLPMTPSPLSLPTIAIDESTQSLADYLASSCAMFNIPTNNQQSLAPVIDDSIGYETLHDSITNHFIDLDQPYNNSGWIDTPLSNFDTVMETMSTSTYTTYDYLCL